MGRSKRGSAGSDYAHGGSRGLQAYRSYRCSCVLLNEKRLRRVPEPVVGSRFTMGTLATHAAAGEPPMLGSPAYTINAYVLFDLVGHVLGTRFGSCCGFLLSLERGWSVRGGTGQRRPGPRWRAGLR